jgi:Zn-dependent peptidase ImmA (M78 family)
MRFRETEMRPYIRFLLSKELFIFLCKSKHEFAKDFSNAPDEILDIQGNIFAGNLLIPANQIRKEVERLDCSLDIISQLTKTFWVSKALMNRRLSDYIDNFN